ncbi:phospholipase A2 inhibitor and Ly6/PLAUR domain-containing protein-like [Puntigrus tetrazona]|uniref:phospholipase A2 inhibitor and Ly6/PLAUR domain-containing protein-like n=1 Tax=Puntigrus tetrazona TaxID=1606681 RepID=UPI001C88E57F|nr:phospholipase A2 inhibitor and Ly6/PLAUR domain-containing protein-like [Puntigrus tetrazona]
MDLQISVFLLFSLFTAGHSLSCYHCWNNNGSCVDQNVITCPSGFSECLSVYVYKVGETTFKQKFKNCTADCKSGSMNLGFIKTSSSCCNTDLCNQIDPDPNINIPNGNKCYYCDYQNCSRTVSCFGIEDHCFTLARNFSQELLKGCVSESYCDALASIHGEGFSCCEGSLCNDAQSTSTNNTHNIVQSVNQSVLFLCCSLSFILLLN